MSKGVSIGSKPRPIRRTRACVPDMRNSFGRRTANLRPVLKNSALLLSYILAILMPGIHGNRRGGGLFSSASAGANFISNDGKSHVFGTYGETLKTGVTSSVAPTLGQSRATTKTSFASSGRRGAAEPEDCGNPYHRSGSSYR